MTASAPLRIVTVGASAGGVEALKDLVSGLPIDFSACVLVVLHVPSSGTSALPAILDRAGPLPARHAADGEPLEGGVVLVAPPDHHLLVTDGHVMLSRGPRENGHRPAVDVLFRSAARAHGSRVTGVVLSGSQDDGAAGLVAVSQRGGTCLVQDFEEALYDQMPRAAARAVGLPSGLLVKEIATTVVEAVEIPVGNEPPATELMRMETAMAGMDPEAMHDHDRPGEPSGFGCPDCHGALFSIEEGGLLRFRCRVGHAWSAESLLARQANDLESALWMALRSLEEKATLQHHMAARAFERGSHITASRFAAAEQEALNAAELVRRLVTSVDAAHDASLEDLP